MTTPLTSPALAPLTPETDLPRLVQIVRLEWTPDDIDVSPDEIREVEPVLIVIARPVAGARKGLE